MTAALITKLMAEGAADDGSARAVILDIQDAFRQKDYARLATRYDDDIEWVFYGPASVFPDLGYRRGKIEVFKSLAALNALYRFDSHVTEILLARNDCVASVADVRLTQRASARIIRCKIASFIRLRDGRVAEYRGFTDSFDVVEQVLGHELAL